MLRFIEKSEYWRFLDQGVESVLAKPKFPWHLKSIQDVIVASMLKDMQGKKIAEIGGSFTRLLPHLAKSNQCYNIDRFNGSHGGASEVPQVDGVEIHRCYLGVDSDFIPQEEFDVLYSVSVVEHVPTDGLARFFAEQHRVMKPGGLAVHLIDAYLSDEDNHHLEGPIAGYLEPLLNGKFESATIGWSARDIYPLKFSTRMATNPDNVMHQWNAVAPVLRNRRENTQSVSLLWVGRRI